MDKSLEEQIKDAQAHLANLQREKRARRDAQGRAEGKTQCSLCGGWRHTDPKNGILLTENGEDYHDCWN